MSRPYCIDCHFPETTCVCKAVDKHSLPLNVLILQHPKERKNAKNTARLAKLVSDEIQLMNIEGPNVIDEAIQNLNHAKTAILFPNELSRPLENIVNEESDKQKALGKIQTQRQFDTLILLDGSWKQVFGIWASNQKLHQFSSYHFDKAPSRQYRIRKAKKDNHLSTIEALAYALSLLSACNGHAYLKVFEKMQQNWERYS